MTMSNATLPPDPPGRNEVTAPLASADRLAAAHERAGRLLSDRYGEGSITERDFERLLARLRDATMPEAVEAVVEDLHHIPRVDAVAAAASLRAHPTLPRDERRLLAVMSETKRRGAWDVPRLLRVRALMADLKLDFREATIPEGFTIDLHTLMSSVVITVPRDVVVDLDVFPVMATTNNNAPDFPESVPGTRHIRITGSAVMADVKVIVRSL